MEKSLHARPSDITRRRLKCIETGLVHVGLLLSDAEIPRHPADFALPRNYLSAPPRELGTTLIPICRSRCDLQALDEAPDALQRLFEKRHRRGVAHADVAAAAFAEGRAGDDSDLLFVEQALGELHVAEAGRADGGEAVEGALGLEGRQPDLVQPGDGQATPGVELGDELAGIVFAVAD